MCVFLFLFFSWCRDERCLCHLALSNRTDARAPISTLCAGMAWHRRPQQRRCSVGNLATHFKFHTGWTKQTYHVHLKLLAGGNTLEDCDARQLLHQPGTEISQHLLPHLFARKGVCTHPRSPEPEPEGCCAPAIWCSSSHSTKPLRFTIYWNIPLFDLCSTITLYASIF